MGATTQHRQIKQRIHKLREDERLAKEADLRAIEESKQQALEELAEAEKLKAEKELEARMVAMFGRGYQKGSLSFLSDQLDLILPIEKRAKKDIAESAEQATLKRAVPPDITHAALLTFRSCAGDAAKRLDPTITSHLPGP